MTTPKWKHTFKLVDPSPATKVTQDSQDVSGGTLYSSHSWYQRLVQGSSTRQTRYREYDNMDDDVEVARALDTIAEEMTQRNRKTGMLFDIDYVDVDGQVGPGEAATIRAALRYWCQIHDFEARLFKIARNMIKYGDCWFRKRKGDTDKWEYVHPKNVVAAIVDEHDVTNIIGWQIRKDTKKPQTNIGGIAVGGQQYETELVPGDEILFFSLNDDMSETAPFGESILKPVYRSFKQKSLLEDSVIIYRISRAPERRVFYIDVGKMPPQRVKQYLEQIKNEVRQKKIPTSSGVDGAPQIESVFNPHSAQEDFYFAQRADGKGSRVETLPGGAGLGELSDLEYFSAKVYRGLRVPTSYMQVTANENNPIFNDGRIGQAYIEELRFAEFCMRLQRNIDVVCDGEFKKFLRACNINVDSTSFKLKLPEPTNFGLYKQQESDAAILGTLAQADGIPSIAKRYAMIRFGQLDEDEILHNEKLLIQERGLDPNDPELYKKLYGMSEEDMGLGDNFGGGLGGSVGGFGGDLGGDMFAGDEFGGAEGAPEMGGDLGGTPEVNQ